MKINLKNYFIFFIIFGNYAMEYGDDENPFAQGLSFLIHDEIRTSETNPLLAYNNLISQETQELIYNFLSLPYELQEHIVNFFDENGNDRGASLAFFSRFSYISQKTRKNVYEKLKWLHTYYLIKKLIHDPSDKNIHSLLQQAITFGPALKKKSGCKHLYKDLEDLDAITRNYFVDLEKFSPSLDRYIKNVKNKEKNSDFEVRYYKLNIVFLEVIKNRIANRIDDCEYIDAGARLCCCCSGSFVLCTTGVWCNIVICLQPSLLPTVCSFLDYVMGALCCSAYSMHMFYNNAPEKILVYNCSKHCSDTYPTGYNPCIAIAHTCNPSALTPYKKKIAAYMPSSRKLTNFERLISLLEKAIKELNNDLGIKMQ